MAINMHSKLFIIHAHSYPFIHPCASTLVPDLLSPFRLLANQPSHVLLLLVYVFFCPRACSMSTEGGWLGSLIFALRGFPFATLLKGHVSGAILQQLQGAAANQELFSDDL